MRTVNVKKGRIIPLGRLGESEATRVVFDVKCWVKTFGAGSFELLSQRPDDSAAYPCVIEQDAENVRWDVQSADVACSGYGKLELIYRAGGTVAKSEIYSTVIGAALIGGAEPPEPWEDWVERVLAAGAAAQEAKEQWESMSAEAETLPAGTPATASYSDGVLHLGIPRGSGGGASSWGEIADKPFDTIGDNLKVVGRALTVDTAGAVQQDNTKPITSAAVYTEVGNINALLALI